MAKNQIDPTGPTKDDDDEERNVNEIRDLIYISLSVAEYSKIPFLFLGNPGIAKTTGVRMWAEQYGYKVTTLIGTQRVAEEILGYMVNDTSERRLITYTPDWFDEIMENKRQGFKTLLFIDELSQAADNVQGAMLQLIFDRKVGGKENFLPEDCLVVSAANYKGNIPPQCGIQAPTLNRFCIINVRPFDGVGLVEEFLQTKEEREANIPVFAYVNVTPAIEDSVRKILKTIMCKLFEQYNPNDGYINIQNTDFSDIFDQPGPIYGFITGRTIHYLYQIALACVHFGIIRKKFKRHIIAFCLGLVGLGTNNFKTPQEKDDYHTYIIRGFQTVLRKAVEENINEINAVELNYKKKSVEKCISEWMRYHESNGNVNDINIQRLTEIIEKTYPPTVQGMEAVINKWDNNTILMDLNKIDTMRNYLKNMELFELKPVLNKIELICNTYEAYKTAILNSL